MTIGIDLSLTPYTWASLGRGVTHGVLETADPSTAREALARAGVRERTVALAIPTREFAMGTSVRVQRTSLKQARGAAALRVAQDLNVDPGSLVVSVDHAGPDLVYAAAPRETVTRWMAPWEAAKWRVAVIEPAATALLRGAGGDAVELFVRTAPGTVDLVAGSQTRWGLARTIEMDWAADLALARVHIEETIRMARDAGLQVARIVVGGDGPVASLMGMLTGLLPVRPLTMPRDGNGSEAPPVIAIAMARWHEAPARRRPIHLPRIALNWRPRLRIRRRTGAA